jgi:agmatinase
MTRIYSMIPSSHILQLGIRSMSAKEADLVSRERYNIVHAREIMQGGFDLGVLLQCLPDQVYITLDVDALDPSVIRSTGTPEPGGLDWYTTLSMLEQIFQAKHVVGFDIVELSAGDISSAFTTARLIYRMIGLWDSAQGLTDSIPPSRNPASGSTAYGFSGRQAHETDSRPHRAVVFRKSSLRRP